MLKTSAFIVSVLVWLIGSAWSQAIPQGYLLPEKTLSPDHRYGVLVPQPLPEPPHPVNQLIEVQTGRVLAEIIGNTGWTRMNHGAVLPTRWTKDSSVLFWQVDGKWGPISLVLVRIKNGEVLGQTDLYQEVVKAILTRTREARPQEYSQRKNDLGYGSAYPDGFTIDIYAEGEEGAPLTFPLKIHADLTSDPKGISEKPLTSYLDGTVDQEGKFTVTNFKLGAAEKLRQW